MEKKLLILFIIGILALSLISFSLLSDFFAKEKGYFYLLEFHHKKGEVTLLNLVLKEGDASPPLFEPENGWRCELLSFKNEILYSLKFFPPDVIYPGPSYLEETEFILTAPYFKEAKAINIFNSEGDFKLSVDVTGFSEERLPIPPSQKRSFYLRIFLLILIIIGLVSAWLWQKRKR